MKSMIKSVGRRGQISKMTGHPIHADTGLKWEAIISRKGPHGDRLYSFRIGKAFGDIANRENDWMRILPLHPDHDATYRT
ncbi:MAG: hypothetical protein EHM30_15575 [Desulfobacteraceae bacterium]|nr:MAG: hypothetical protein EHM30_15575 [Desulfobacteraceae bacterium]